MVGKEEVSKVLSRLGGQHRHTMLQAFADLHSSPFQLLIATILSARAKDEVTEVVAKNLFKIYPDAYSLAKAKPKDVIPLIKRIGFYNNKAKMIIESSRMVRDDFKGKVPDTLEGLTSLPGVGRKVANCVLVYAFKKDAIPVDTHVHRVSNRLGWVRTKDPEDTERRLERIVPKRQWRIVNDCFVWHGKTVCLPVSPLCSECLIKDLCKRVSVRISR
ncbi:MAG: endonuclease III [Nanoarchaeota archaeon]